MASTVIDEMYAAFMAGDVEGAMACCAPDAQWHAVTPTPDWNGSYPIRRYWEEILPQAIGLMSGYKVLSDERQVYGNLTVAFIRSNYGEGTMTFRIVNGKVTDIWAINIDGREATGYF